MKTRPFFKSAVVLLAVLVCRAAAAATPEEEAKFVEGVKKAFEEKKPGDVAKLTCWDGISEQGRKKDEEVYKLLMEEKDITFGFKLVEADLKERKDHHVPPRPNLKIVKQLDLTMMDTRDNKKILGIIGFAVGEKDGKLLLVRELPEK